MERNLFTAFLSIFGTKIGVIVITVVSTPLIVRLLGSGDYGDYALVMSVFSVLTVIANSGIFNGVRKYIAEDRPISKWTDIIFSFYFRVSIFITSVLALSITVLSQSAFVAELLAPEFQLYFVILAVYLFISQFYSIGRGTLMGFGLEHHSEPIQLVEKFIYAFIGLILLYYGFGVSGLLISHAIAILIVSVIVFWLIRNKVTFHMCIKPTPDVVSRYDLLAFNVYSILLAFLTISLYNVDILLLRPIVGSSETGFYKASLVVAEFLWMIPVAIQYTLVHSTSEMWSKNKQEQITNLASTVTRLNLSLMVIMAIGLAALAEDFVLIYFGAEFAPAVGPLLILLPGVLGLALAKPIFAIGQGKGELRALVVTTCAAATLNLGLNLLLIPRYGMNGAAVATSVGYGSMFVFHTWTANQIGFNPISDIRIKKIATAGIGTAPIVFGLSTWISGILALIIIPPIGFIVYTIFSLRMGVIDKNEIKQLQNRSPDIVDPLYEQIYRTLINEKS